MQSKTCPANSVWLFKLTYKLHVSHHPRKRHIKKTEENNEINKIVP